MPAGFLDEIVPLVRRAIVFISDAVGTFSEQTILEPVHCTIRIVGRRWLQVKFFGIARACRQIFNSDANVPAQVISTASIKINAAPISSDGKKLIMGIILIGRKFIFVISVGWFCAFPSRLQLAKSLHSL